MTHLPVFIGGFRSGSTLLASYLGLHPRIAAIYETKFLADLLRIARILQNDEGRGERELGLAAQWAPGTALAREEAVEFLVQRAVADINLSQQVLDGRASDGKAPHERYALGSNHIRWKASQALDAIGPFVQAVRAGDPQHALVSALAAGIAALFAGHARGEGKHRWANKTPELPRFQPELRQMLGPVKFIHLIRDGRDVVNSSVKLGWWSAETGAQSWKIFIEDARAQAACHPADYLELRYEDLVTDHAGTLEKVLEFLELDGDPRQMVAAQERHAPGSTSRRAAEQRMGVWRSEMSANDRAAFKAVANDLLVGLGYAASAHW